MTDVDKLISLLLRNRPGLSVEQLKVAHPGDDDGLWFFRPTEGAEPEIKVESADGLLPFLIEGPDEGQRKEVRTLEQAAETLGRWLKAQRKTQ